MLEQFAVTNYPGPSNDRESWKQLGAAQHTCMSSNNSNNVSGYIWLSLYTASERILYGQFFRSLR